MIPSAALAAEPRAPLPDDAPFLERIFEIEAREERYRLDGVIGTIPPFVRGTYYVNGPARFRRGELGYRHWLDGDGMVVALRFDDDGVRLTNRYVRSAKLEAEEAAGRALFRTFGTTFEGDRLARGVGLESPANVSVFPYAGTLLAFGEQGLPYELDPDTLETRGLYTFGRRLNPISPFSAHPCFDPWTGDLVNFGVSFDPRRPAVTLYQATAEGEVTGRHRIPIDLPVSMHDFGITRNHAIFHLSPFVLDVRGILDRDQSVMESLDWQGDRGTRLLVVGRDDGKAIAEIAIGDRYCLHLINCFETGDETGDENRLVVDLVEFDEPVYREYEPIPDLFQTVTPGRPVRFRIDLESGRLESREELDYDRSPDFPAIDPRRSCRATDDLWLLGISRSGEPGRKFFDQLAHLSWEEGAEPDVFQSPSGSYLGCEPVFIPDPTSPDQGIILVKQFDATTRRDAYLLFDAFDVARGPIARLPLRHPIPPGFHAVFEPF